MGSVIYRRRQDIDIVDENQYWWYSRSAYIAKWSIFGAFLLIFLLWFLGGYLHAQRRMKKGLPPLRYHKFLVPYAQRAQFDLGLQNQFSFYRAQNQGYGMDETPPPIYDPNHVPPPTYQPPEGPFKVHANQDYAMPPPDPSPRQTENGPATPTTV